MSKTQNPENVGLPSGIEGYMNDAEIIFNLYTDMMIPKSEQADAISIIENLSEFNEGCYDLNWPHCDDIGTLIINKVDGETSEFISGWSFEIYSEHCDKTYTNPNIYQGC